MSSPCRKLTASSNQFCRRLCFRCHRNVCAVIFLSLFSLLTIWFEGSLFDDVTTTCESGRYPSTISALSDDDGGSSGRSSRRSRHFSLGQLRLEYDDRRWSDVKLTLLSHTAGVDERSELLSANIGRSLAGRPRHVTSSSADRLRIAYADGFTLTVAAFDLTAAPSSLSAQSSASAKCYRIIWEAPSGCPDYRFLDTFRLQPNSAGDDEKSNTKALPVHWYGGPPVRNPRWPTSLLRRGQRPEPLVTGNSYVDEFGGISERFWTSSLGVSLHVEYDVPLFVGWNSGLSANRQRTSAADGETVEQELPDGFVDLEARFKFPYGNFARRRLTLNYTICSSPDAREAYLVAAGRFWNRPTGVPDENMFRKPIWSTWAMYKVSINEDNVMDLAQQIVARGFNHSHLEIDDGWAMNYGDFDFDFDKFPDPAAMVKRLKTELGFRITLWIHPFASLSSSAAWLRDWKGQSFWLNRRRPYQLGSYPAVVPWWEGFGTLLNVSHVAAVEWFLTELAKLRQEVGIDSFKFDAGESNLMPWWRKGDPTLDNPNEYTRRFVDIAYRADAGMGLVETRVGVSTQHYPIFVRLMDKQSFWTTDNGLRTLIPSALLHGMMGYPFVLPDMIGGNAYNWILIHSTVLPDRELYIRWLQATALMPAIQFSVVPWQYDDQVVELALSMCKLHESMGDLIISLAKQSTQTGAPIMRPMWWASPNDTEAQVIDDQFMLGDDILVAPVLDQGATERDIYLPAGRWRDERPSQSGAQLIAGRNWLRNYRVPLDELAYFRRIA